MKKLWTFGDSFIQYHDEQYGWVKEIGKQLNCEHRNYALHGTSLSYTYKQYYDNRHNIHAKDIVIIALTSSLRKWFFEDRPTLAGYWSDLPREQSTTEENNALKQYVLYLNKNNTEIEVNLYMFLKTVNSMHNAIIIANFEEIEEYVNQWRTEFENLNIANGYLWKMSADELKNTNDLAKITARDTRYCHMSEENHNILANKIIRAVNNNESIDLNTDFVKGIL